MSKLFIRCAWLALALSPFAAPSMAAAAAVPFPRYEVTPCCQLCPAASDLASYNTKYLSSFRTLVQGSDGWMFRSEADLLTNFDPGPDGLERLDRLRRALHARGVELVIAMQPPRGLMHADKLKNSGVNYDPDVARAAYARVLQQLRDRGLIVPNLEKLVEEGGGEDYFWRADHHWTPEGTRRTARLVAERVRKMPQYKALKHQRFVTTREGVIARGGTLNRAAQVLCGYGAPKQYVPRFVTTPAEADDASGLFGDDAVPQITLIGTSNSEDQYNFSGYLSEFLETDVLNASVRGGGLDGAMLSYLPSEEFRRNPPKIIIWELETYHKLGDPLFYRQALPLLDNGCNDQTPVLERKLTLRDGRNEVLFNGGGTVRNLRSRDHFVDVQFSDPAVREMRAVVWYTNGGKDTLRIEHSARAPSHQGRFVVQLRDDAGFGEQVFLSMDIETLPPAAPAAGAASVAPPPAPAAAAGPMQVHARLCTNHGPKSGAAVTAGLTEQTR